MYSSKHVHPLAAFSKRFVSQRNYKIRISKDISCSLPILPFLGSSERCTPVAVGSPQLPAACGPGARLAEPSLAARTSWRASPCQVLQVPAGCPWLLPQAGSSSVGREQLQDTASHRTTHAGPPHSTLHAPLRKQLMFLRPSLSGSHSGSLRLELPTAR